MSKAKPSPKTDKLESLKAKSNGKPASPKKEVQKSISKSTSEETPTDPTIKVVSVENETEIW